MRLLCHIGRAGDRLDVPARQVGRQLDFLPSVSVTLIDAVGPRPA